MFWYIDYLTIGHLKQIWLYEGSFGIFVSESYIFGWVVFCVYFILFILCTIHSRVKLWNQTNHSPVKK